jgi:hypothetical protein
MRKRVYPSWVSKGKISQDGADREIACMEAILLTLQNEKFAIDARKLAVPMIEA